MVRCFWEKLKKICKMFVPWSYIPKFDCWGNSTFYYDNLFHVAPQFEDLHKIKLIELFGGICAVWTTQHSSRSTQDLGQMESACHTVAQVWQHTTFLYSPCCIQTDQVNNKNLCRVWWANMTVKWFSSEFSIIGWTDLEFSKTYFQSTVDFAHTIMPLTLVFRKFFL